MKHINSKKNHSFFVKTFTLIFLFFAVSLSAQITTPVAGTEYYIKNVYSGNYMENSDGNYCVHRTYNEARIQRQKFTFELSGSSYKIRNVGTGYYMYRGGDGWTTYFQATTDNVWILEANGGKTIIKYNGSNHLGIDTSGEGIYWSKAWSTSPLTRLQWEITFASYGKTALQTAITSATTTKNNAVVGTANGNYFQSDYDVLVAAIAAAQSVFDNPTDQAQINSAVTTLNTAVSTFNASVINKTALQSAITSSTLTKNAAIVGTTQGEYLQSDYDTFVAAIAAAQGIYDSPTSQAQITTATSTLNTAATTFTSTMVKFVPTPGRYYTIKFKELDIALSKSSGGTSTQILTTNSSDVLQRIRFVADDTYPGSYWIYNGENQALDQVYANSWDLIWEVPGSGSTYNGYRYYIETVNQTDIRIKSVKSGGYLGNSGGGDGSDVYADKNNTNYWKNIATEHYYYYVYDLLPLESAINSAISTKNAATVGTEDGNFFQTDYDALVTAITSAQEIYNNPTSQEQINSTVTSLNSSVETFIGKAINKSLLFVAISDANDKKNTLVTGTSQGQFLLSDYDVFVAAITAAQNVYNTPGSLTEINNAVTNLNSAVTAISSKMIQFVPESGRFYMLKYKELDQALSKNVSSTVTELAEPNLSDSLQLVRFVADMTFEGSYLIYNMKDMALDQVYANSWGLVWEVPSLGSTYNGYRYYIETVNQTDIRIKSVKSGGYLGNIGVGDGSVVYADKANTSYWKNIATNKYLITTTINTFDNLGTSNFVVDYMSKTIQLKTPENGRIELYDLNSNLIMSSDNVNCMSYSSLLKGVYIIRATQNSRTYTEKLLIL